MDFLKAILGDELYSKFEAKLNEYNGKEENKEKQVKLADLGSGNYVDKGKLADSEANTRAFESKLAEANKLIEEMKKSSKDNENLNSKIAEYEAQLKEKDKELAREHLENAIKIGLMNAKATDIDYLSYKLKTSDNELKLDDSGQVKGWDDMLASLKKQYPNQFENAEVRKIDVNKLPNDNNNQGDRSGNTLASALKEYYTADK